MSRNAAHSIPGADIFPVIATPWLKIFRPRRDLPSPLPGQEMPGARVIFQALGINSCKVTSFSEPRRISGPQVPVPDDT